MITPTPLVVGNYSLYKLWLLGDGLQMLIHMVIHMVILVLMHIVIHMVIHKHVYTCT
jgi:hypothetical protein